MGHVNNNSTHDITRLLYKLQAHVNCDVVLQDQSGLFSVPRVAGNR